MGDARRRLVILGAAGRDFHDFNVYWKQQESVEVVAFTATQIPNIDGRVYPPELCGPRYPQGIPIVAESDLESLIRDRRIDEATFAYSDVPHAHVMNLAARAAAAGAEFRLLSPRQTMLTARKPVIAVCAVRTGSGKSQTSRRVCDYLRQLGRKVAVVRHPMPYGDLRKQVCQRFETVEDMARHECTIEEREEYEHHIRNGSLVFAGIDYARILAEAEQAADVVLWDGGNNDTPFFKPNLFICVADPHRPGHELAYHPGETNFRMADVIVVNKCDTAEPKNIEIVERHARQANPRATLIRASSPIRASDPGVIRGKRVLLVEDGPTLTHGEMTYGAAWVAARQFGAAQIVDPRPFARGSIVEVFRKYGHLTQILPAMGYGPTQMKELEDTVNAADADLVLIGTPIDLGQLLRLNKLSVRIFYDLLEQPEGALKEHVARVAGG
ncbi:MAG: GTPase [Phycisphaerae bacterium]|nr:cyclic 2,3-diphosphoglycerate synthase [Phycisphaerae bacterium]NUQ46956.1 GTPase [Phycisphaerae bacterium]